MAHKSLSAPAGERGTINFVLLEFVQHIHLLNFFTAFTGTHTKYIKAQQDHKKVKHAVSYTLHINEAGGTFVVCFAGHGAGAVADVTRCIWRLNIGNLQGHQKW